MQQFIDEMIALGFDWPTILAMLAQLIIMVIVLLVKRGNKKLLKGSKRVKLGDYTIDEINAELDSRIKKGVRK